MPRSRFKRNSGGLFRGPGRADESERMKIELITNVSHDIKTPLTSIIGYVELLEKEEDLPEHVKDYIKILSKKSQRLKTMVQDIFDVSKASSGEMKLDIEELDLVKLIRQTLADMDEDISGSNLIFKINLPNDPVMIRGDGERLYRVFQNVIKNSLQYSLEGSRVYISLYRDDSWTTVMIKNTSKYELGALERILPSALSGEMLPVPPKAPAWGFPSRKALPRPAEGTSG